MPDKSRIHEAPQHPLGRTGFLATRLGIGDLADRSLGLEACVATLHQAMDYGLNVIDTAPGYEEGFSEQVVGAALRGRREGIFLIDKVDFHDRPAGPQVDESLRRLKVDATDAFVLHALSSMDGWQAAAAPGGLMDQLDGCIAAGKTRFRGISTHDPEVLAAAIDSELCDLVMFAIGPRVDRRYLAMLEKAKAVGVATVCFKTFGAGKLVADTSGYGRPLEPPVPPTGSGPALPHLSIGECVHYTLTCGPDVALLGMSTAAELEAALAAAASFRPLSSGELAVLEAQAAEAVKGKGRCHWDPAELISRG